MLRDWRTGWYEYDGWIHDENNAWGITEHDNQRRRPMINLRTTTSNSILHTERLRDFWLTYKVQRSYRKGTESNSISRFFIATLTTFLALFLLFISTYPSWVIAIQVYIFVIQPTRKQKANLASCQMNVFVCGVSNECVVSKECETGL